MMTEKILRTPRGDVHYWLNENYVSGRRTLVMLHGLTADHTLFDRQTEYFAGSSNIIVWDAPAHGLSRPYGDFSYPNAADDLKAILDENGIAAAVLIGQSMGGYISQSFLLRYPQSAVAFIGIDTCPYGSVYYSRADMWWLRQVEWMSRLYPLNSMKKAIAEQCTCTEYARSNMMTALAPYGKDELCRLMGIGYAGFLADNQDLNIQCPTLIIVGEHDKTGKVRQYCRAWAKQTGFPLYTVKNAAHNANADNPEDINKRIEVFLQDNGIC